jgi:hypothetical protein
MTAFRGWTSLLGVLCLSGTALAQSNNWNYAPYGAQLSRLDDPSMRSPALSAADVPRSAGQPVMRGPVAGNKAPESVATPAPQPAPASPYENAVADSGWGGGSEGGCGCGCEIGECCSCCGCSNWFAYVGGIVMGRDTPNRFWTTFDATNPANQLLYYPGSKFGGGVDTRIGYWFGCGCNDGCNNNCCSCGGRTGIEAVYWGAWGLDGQSSLYDPGNNLSTVMDDGLVSFNGTSASNFFDNSRSHELSRDDEFHNVEINFLYMPCCGGRFNVTGLAGVRFFRFNEGLQFGALAGSAPVGATFATDPNDAAYLNTDVQNNMIGFQIGAYLNFQMFDRFSVFAIPKIGIYGNHINGHNELIGGDGTVATFDASGDNLNFHNTKDVFSMVGSIDVGFNWAFCPHWSLLGGYRVVAATGVALGDNQIPQFFADEAGWQHINSNGSLILHGAFAGVEARF